MRSLADSDSMSASAAPQSASFPISAAMAISNARRPSCPWVAIPQGRNKRKSDAGVIEELQARGPLHQREMPRRVFEQHRFVDHREFEVRGRIVDRDAGVLGQQHHHECDSGKDRHWDRPPIGCAA